MTGDALPDSGKSTPVGFEPTRGDPIGLGRPTPLAARPKCHLLDGPLGAKVQEQCMARRVQAIKSGSPASAIPRDGVAEWSKAVAQSAIP